MEEEVDTSLKRSSLKQSIEDILIKTLKLRDPNETLKILSIDFTNGAKAGDNYLSNLQRATVKGVKKSGEDYFKTFIVKLALSQEEHSAFFDYTKLWFNEINVYKEVIPLIEKACGKKLYHPKLLYGDADFIILEDLKPFGYVMMDRRAGLDLEHAMVALEEVANFHSGSIIIRHNDKNIYSMIKNKIGTHPYQQDDGISGSIPLIQNAIDTAVKRLTELEEDRNKYTVFINYIRQVKSNIGNILESIVKMKPSVFTVVAHGDFYINNFLFSYSEDRSVNRLMLVDYQGTRIMNLILDLHHMIYTSLQPKVRREHLDTLLKHYHYHLISNLRKFGDFDNDYLERTLSFDDFRREFHNNHVVGLISALTILPAMTYSPENIPEMNKITKSWENNNDNENMEQFYTVDLTERLEELAEEYIKNAWCIL